MFQAKIAYDPECRKDESFYPYDSTRKKTVTYQQWFYNAMREYRNLKAEYAFQITDSGIVLTINS